MTKKDLGNLLAPNILFIVLAVAALILGTKADSYTDAAQASERERKFEAFVQNVESGEWELTPERWIQAMRQQRKIDEADREYLNSIAEFLRVSGWVGFGTVIVQIVIVFSVKAKLKKTLRQTDSTLH